MSQVVTVVSVTVELTDCCGFSFQIGEKNAFIEPGYAQSKKHSLYLINRSDLKHVLLVILADSIDKGANSTHGYGLVKKAAIK